MARRKNYKRRRTILSNTFHLIRENGMDSVSFQMIAEKWGFLNPCCNLIIHINLA